ncbi:type IV secretory system conjugative DNA transfer family protein [Arthrobacter monumenti]
MKADNIFILAGIGIVAAALALFFVFHLLVAAASAIFGQGGISLVDSIAAVKASPMNPMAGYSEQGGLGPGWLVYGLLALLVCAAGYGLYRVMVWKASRKKLDGMPAYKEVKDTLGRPAAVRQARKILELPADVDEKDIIVHLCRLAGRDLYMQHEDSTWCYAPQRSGKTLFIAVGQLLDAPGPVVATSTKNDLLMHTAVGRQRAGDVHVFDLQNISGWPDTVRWNPLDGCEDPEEALKRGKAWAGAQPMGNVKGGDWFNAKAGAVLGRYMHAAALAGLSMREVNAWSMDLSNTEPIGLLRQYKATPGFVERLESLVASRAGETVDSIQETIAGLLEPLSSPRALEMLCPPKGESFDVNDFLAGRNTLYLLSDRDGEMVAPLLSMFADHIVRTGQKEAQKRVGGRLWPVLTMILDEAVNTAAFPSMASVLSDSGGRGIRVIGFSQTFAQVRERWGRDGAEAIKGACTVKMYLPGLEDLDELEKIAKSMGPQQHRRQSTTSGPSGGSITWSNDEKQRMRAEQIQQMDVGQAMIAYRNLRPARVQLTPFWERADAVAIRDDKRAAEKITGRTT